LQGALDEGSPPQVIKRRGRELCELCPGKALDVLVELVEAGGEQAVEHLTLDFPEEGTTLWSLDPPRQRLAKVALGRLAELACDRFDLPLKIDPEPIEDSQARISDLTGAPLDLFPHAGAQTCHQAEARPGRFPGAETGHRQPPRECEQEVLQRRRDELADKDWVDCVASPACGRRRGRGDYLAEPGADRLWKNGADRQALIASALNVSIPGLRGAVPEDANDVFDLQRIGDEPD
jgi:hypothetical protein